MALLNESEKAVYFQLVRAQRAQGNLDPLKATVVLDLDRTECNHKSKQKPSHFTFSLQTLMESEDKSDSVWNSGKNCDTSADLSSVLEEMEASVI